MTSEQLEAARAERMRQNGHGPLTFEDARTWMEETGLCLFLPKRQFAAALAPSFVEAVGGERNSTPDPKQIAAAEELLVRLELEGVAVRLNLLGQPGEQPDYVVAAWVLPYVYALRGDRDWRRSPQLTGSRQVSPLAIQAYKRLETADSAIAQLKLDLGQGVSEMAVLRAITELWQQLRIVPVVAAPGQPAKWQLLRHRFQKAIAEGASTSQVTAISVLASIFLQAVIAASMEEVEVFLSPLTARSKIREVIRGLVATRQVHTLSLGHAPHFYVAGTLPEFAPAPTIYSSAANAYFAHLHDHEESLADVAPEPAAEPEPAPARQDARAGASSGMRGSGSGKPASSRPHFGRTPAHSRDRKPAHGASNGRPANRATGESRSSASRPATSGRTASGVRPASGTAKSGGAPRSGNGARGAAVKPARTNGSGHAGHSLNGSRTAKPASGGRSATLSRTATTARKDARPDARGRDNRKPAMASGGTAKKRFSFNGKQGTKKRG